MEEFLDGNVYLIDLSNIESIPEIIFELSSILDKDDAKNRRICLKLGNVNLNQAQLLSIKSLISGIGSSLSSIDTKSIETEKTALSLGIIVSNVLPENASEVAPALPYKMADEIKENNDAIVEEENLQEQVFEINNENEEQEVVQNSENNEIIEHKEENKENVNDELDVIFGNNPLNSSIFKMEQPSEIYAEREELTDIVVPETEYTKEDLEIEAFPTKYIKQTIRSGQVINYEGNIVIIGDCHPGCEITAFGDITVWGVLSGIAHAGAGGNQKARVRALKMNAIQLRIANCYSRRPDSLNTIYVEKTNSFTPEEARIINGEIVVFKIND